MEISVHTEIARGEHGAFTPLPRAVVTDAGLRDELAAGIPVPSLAGLAKVRLATALLAAFPMLLLLELDREDLAADVAPAGRLVADFVLAAFTAFELTRRTPRMPRIAAAAILAVALRWALVAMRSCGRGVHVSVWAAAGLAVGAGALWLARAPTASRVALELGGRLGLTRQDLLRARAEEDEPVSSSLFGTAIAAAVGLPAALFVARRAHLALAAQAVALVAYAVVVPELVKRLDSGKGASTLGSPGRDLVHPVALVLAIGAGLAASVALVSGGEAFMKAGTELARCADKLDAEAKRLVAAQARELAEAVRRVRASTWLGVVSVAVVPLAEERIYRGVLLPVLVRRYGRAYGLFATSLAFAFAHAGVYEIAVWQTALLGFAFGIAYLEGGLVAAFATHAVWNLLQLV